MTNARPAGVNPSSSVDGSGRKLNRLTGMRPAISLDSISGSKVAPDSPATSLMSPLSRSVS